MQFTECALILKSAGSQQQELFSRASHKLSAVLTKKVNAMERILPKITEKIHLVTPNLDFSTTSGYTGVDIDNYGTAIHHSIIRLRSCPYVWREPAHDPPCDCQPGDHLRGRPGSV
jgi:hypothetical protein